MRMFAVVAKKYEKTASVKLMATTKKQAIALWERWNPGSSFDGVKAAGVWVIRKYDVLLQGVTKEEKAIQALVEYGFTRSCAIETVSGRPVRSDDPNDV